MTDQRMLDIINFDEYSFDATEDEQVEVYEKFFGKFGANIKNSD